MFTLLEDFSSAHVDHVHVSFRVNHNILRFYVSVDDISRMEILHAEDKSTNIELTVLC